MNIHVGYEFVYELPQSTPMILALNVHSSRAADLIVPDQITTNPMVPIKVYRDRFGNWCSRLTAAPGRFRLTGEGVVKDSGRPDPVVPSAQQHAIEALPEDSLLFLVGSRYCETDRLTPMAWQLFGSGPRGWPLVQAICDYVHNHITFNYQNARSTRTAWDAYNERTGVCRDFAHLAITFCRCMNIPARYCTGYLGDMGTPPPYSPMDFAAWMEVYLGGAWYSFDPRNNVPRIGRTLIAQGRDAADVAMVTTFGPATLFSMKVWTDEVPEAVAVS